MSKTKTKTKTKTKGTPKVQKISPKDMQNLKGGTSYTSFTTQAAADGAIANGFYNVRGTDETIRFPGGEYASTAAAQSLEPA